MAAIQAGLPAVPKSGTNTQQGFKFRSIDHVIDTLGPLLHEHQVFFVPTVLERVAETRQTSKGNNLYAVCLHVRYTFYDVDGNQVSCDVWGEGSDSGDKATSKAMTMALKSALSQTFAISSEDDPDATTVTETKSAKPARKASKAAPGASAPETPQARASSSPPAQPEMLNRLRTLVDTLQVDANKILTHYGHRADGGFEQLTEEQAQATIATLEPRLKETA